MLLIQNSRRVYLFSTNSTRTEAFETFYLRFAFTLCRHKMDAEQIEKIAKDANDTSTKAYNLLVKTLDGESRTSEEIDELNKKYVAAQPHCKYKASVCGCFSFQFFKLFS